MKGFSGRDVIRPIPMERVVCGAEVSGPWGSIYPGELNC